MIGISVHHALIIIWQFLFITPFHLQGYPFLH